MLVGGEAVSEQLKELLTGMGIVWNVYGPTETTIWSAIKELKASVPVSIGRPIWNTQLYILDGGMRLVPFGVRGELYIGGSGLARGYLNRPELTSSRFVAHPFVAGERLYRTGDICRWLPDGNIEYLGRSDDQVKIRGYRIEPGEIESVLQGHPEVQGAVVLSVAGIQGEQELVGYVVSEQEQSAAGLRGYLSGYLPQYMVPSRYVQVPSFPLTGNGKVDRRALRDLGGSGMGSGVEYEAPRNQTEEKLAAIWADILGKEKISIRDNFFELGGNSLKATRLMGRIHKELLIKLKLEDIFDKPTIEETANELLRRGWATQLPEKIGTSNDFII